MITMRREWFAYLRQTWILAYTDGEVSWWESVSRPRKAKFNTPKIYVHKLGKQYITGMIISYD